MLFNSYEFLFAYLPVVFLGYFFLAPKSTKVAAQWLAIASLFFYGWWNPKYVALLLGSIGFNFLAGILIAKNASQPKGKLLLTVAVVANLLLLAVYKYANFFVASVSSLGSIYRPLDISLPDLVLPLGISFFTFTQIAFLVDVYRGKAREFNLTHYVLFVTWFPHLVAGPVLHHKQMMPQFSLPQTYRPNLGSIAVGLTIFSIGLFKKVVLADQFALYANPVFNAAQNGSEIAFLEAWTGALTYSLQLYFDFSGYSDMAIGLSRIFNIKLPLNFNSPYKAPNIIEFWRRWHMTLSAFLRDYLYLPLGGNRKGTTRRYCNLMTTMVLGGLWHGAGWNFVLWGFMHGVYLIINHGWQTLRTTGNTDPLRHGAATKPSRFGMLFTFIVVVIAWVPFRATDFASTLIMLKGMAGINGITLTPYLEPLIANFSNTYIRFDGFAPFTNLSSKSMTIWVPLGLLIVWKLPNSQEIMARYSPAWDADPSVPKYHWQPTHRYAIVAGIAFATAVIAFKQNSPFLYFQF
jgi:alginate O-acetyltransferase complex protein AlgI